MVQRACEAQAPRSVPNGINTSSKRAASIAITCRPLLIVETTLVDQVWLAPGLAAVGGFVNRYTDPNVAWWAIERKRCQEYVPGIVPCQRRVRDAGPIGKQC